MIDKRSVLTIATGKVLYINFAINLARSFHRWHANADISFRIVTDRPELFPPDITSKSTIVAIMPGELGEGFSSKLFLDQLAPEGQTLFIDSDCLIFGNLNSVFEKFKGMPVSVIGSYISSGEWFGDIEMICKKFGVPHLPKFNGGMYYLEKGDKAIRVYNNARKLEKEYDQIGFVRLRNRPNDEVIMALAMQLENMTPVMDDGNIISDPQACPGTCEIDVFKGSAVLTNPPHPNLLHQSWYPFETVTPLVVHFLGQYTLHYPYRREVYRLSKAINQNLNPLSTLISILIIEYPERVTIFLKNTFRSAYRALFGIRRIKNSDRIIV